MNRNCNECTKCCEGWLTGNVNGKSFYPGKPCHFVEIGKGCAIYDKRPKDPCITFECAWKQSDDFPEWMKPSKCDAIITYSLTKNKIKYINVVEAGKPLDSKVLSWIIEYALENNKNLKWTVEGGSHWIGSTEFCEEMNLSNLE